MTERSSPGRILVVDDIEASLKLLTRLLERDGHTVVPATSSAEALAAITNVQPDLVLLDVMMPGLNGFDLCRAVKSHPATFLTPVVLITALSATEDRIRGIDAGADDFLTKPVNPAELQARVRSLLRIKRVTDELDSAESVITSLALTIEARDPCTDGHCQRLARYAGSVGRQLGLSAEDLAALQRGGFLHDIGKIGIPDAILLKPDRLTRSEYTVIQQHTMIGDRLCGTLRALSRVRPIVRHHHERLDGSGYPDALRGDDIPLLAQILSVVDVFDALTTRRPYKAPMTMEQAIDELHREVKRGWKRQDLVDAFVAAVARENVLLGR
jgi:cyclic di-GMP phosphodiesterase